MAILSNSNQTQTGPGPSKIHEYGMVLYDNDLVQAFLDSSRFWTIFHDRAEPIFGQYGSVHPKTGGFRVVQKILM